MTKTKLPKVILTLLLSFTVVLASVVVASPAQAAPVFSTCAKLRAYNMPNGVAKSMYTSTHASPSNIRTPRISLSSYTANKRLDADHDGVACEVSKKTITLFNKVGVGYIIGDGFRTHTNAVIKISYKLSCDYRYDNVLGVYFQPGVYYWRKGNLGFYSSGTATLKFAKSVTSLYISANKYCDWTVKVTETY